jgi:predicted AAA+ superfamily ATPase
MVKREAAAHGERLARPAGPVYITIILTVILSAMYTRRGDPPDRSFVLLGPRGTGKTTWLRAKLPGATWFDLLRDEVLVELLREPGSFSRRVEGLREGSWVVVDEVQRLPAILDEVQEIMGRRGHRWRFALTGSSARRLSRGGVNLLPGRVVNRRFHPLVMDELGAGMDIGALLAHGGLPAVASAGTARDRSDLLDAYVQNYLLQEVRAEAVVKRLDPFVRFLEVAALANGQVVNVSGIARDAGVARPTVLGYFEALVDTLLGTWVQPWRPRAKVKEVGHPKFYLCDPGVARALAGKVRDAVHDTERGPLLETLVLHELRAWQNDAGTGGDILYWRTPSGSEMDFVWRRGSRAVGVEVKASTRWRKGDGDVLNERIEDGTIGSGWGVYLGDAPLRDRKVKVLPYAQWCAALGRGQVIG